MTSAIEEVAPDVDAAAGQDVRPSVGLAMPEGERRISVKSLVPAPKSPVSTSSSWVQRGLVGQAGGERLDAEDDVPEARLLARPAAAAARQRHRALPPRQKRAGRPSVTRVMRSPTGLPLGGLRTRLSSRAMSASSVKGSALDEVARKLFTGRKLFSDCRKRPSLELEVGGDGLGPRQEGTLLGEEKDGAEEARVAGQRVQREHPDRSPSLTDRGRGVARSRSRGPAAARPWWSLSKTKRPERRAALRPRELSCGCRPRRTTSTFELAHHLSVEADLDLERSRWS